MKTLLAILLGVLVGLLAALCACGDGWGRESVDVGWFCGSILTLLLWYAGAVWDAMRRETP